MIINENTDTQTEIKETGGGTIGFGRATWPFATLTVNRNFLKLSISLIGTVIFRPADIISIEPYFGIKGKGIKINHNVQGYSSTIIFSSMAGNGYLMEEIAGTGFLNNKGPLPINVENEISVLQASGSFPIKIPAAIFFVVVWNALFLSSWLSFFTGRTKQPSFAGPRLGLAFAIIFFLSVLLIPPVRQLVLKQGRQIKEINGFLYFSLAITTIMLLGFSAFPS